MTRSEEKADLEMLIKGLNKHLEKYADEKTAEPDLTKTALIEVFFGRNSIAAKLSYEDN